MENGPQRPSRQERRKDASSTETLGKDEPQTRCGAGRARHKRTHMLYDSFTANVQKPEPMETAGDWRCPCWARTQVTEC